MTAVDTILFDIGGVLTCDPWETVVLTPGCGLADRLGLDRVQAESLGSRLFFQYAISSCEESDYWHDFSLSAGCPISMDLIQQVEKKTFVANNSFCQVRDVLEDQGIEWGFITNNTSFWYPKQLALLGLEDREVSPYVFSSFTYGVTKSTVGRNLFDIAAESIGVACALVIDDRAENVGRAAQAGFSALRYSMYDGIDLAEALTPYLN